VARDNEQQANNKIVSPSSNWGLAGYKSDCWRDGVFAGSEWSWTLLAGSRTASGAGWHALWDQLAACAKEKFPTEGSAWKCGVQRATNVLIHGEQSRFSLGEKEMYINGAFSSHKTEPSARTGTISMSRYWAQSAGPCHSVTDEMYFSPYLREDLAILVSTVEIEESF
jgi:hypothetical protein